MIPVYLFMHRCEGMNHEKEDLMLVPLHEKMETLHEVVGLVDNMSVDPDVKIDYYIPDVLTTVESRDMTNDPFIQFTYGTEGQSPRIQYMPLKDNYLQKTPQDLANLITFHVEQFAEEIDSTFYGAQ